jgi:hypothetical protein
MKMENFKTHPGTAYEGASDVQKVVIARSVLSTVEH